MSRTGPSFGLLVGLVGFAFAGLVSLSLASLQPPGPELPTFEHLGMDFKLESTQDYDSLSSAQGKVVLLSFGFTSCHDICPMMMQKFRRVYEELDKTGQGDQVVMFFVTLDPVRDTLDAMVEYFAGFDSRVVGLRGSMEQIEELQASLAVASQAIAGSDQISHSDRIFLFDTQGTLRAMPSLTDAIEDVVQMVGVLSR